ncbi:hypothetical protein BpHYR1_012676 [Brachionus plicatilis]|uniref:Uncharacterized protein n=1 Tax=Brachionus plicatilis TaxID=10195 RepID=A0A3M7Q5I6_BRAPC|nr:hypothetical protein BpHYR1_012676 [Brachionus plicatilis]
MQIFEWFRPFGMDVVAKSAGDLGFLVMGAVAISYLTHVMERRKKMDGEAEPVRSGPKPTPDDKKLSKLALGGSIVRPECIGEIKRPDFGTLGGDEKGYRQGHRHEHEVEVNETQLEDKSVVTLFKWLKSGEKPDKCSKDGSDQYIYWCNFRDYRIFVKNVYRCYDKSGYGVHFQYVVPTSDACSSPSSNASPCPGCRKTRPIIKKFTLTSFFV